MRLTPRRNPRLQRRARALFEASDAAVVELHHDGTLTWLHAGCASASAALGLGASHNLLDGGLTVANDNAVPARLDDVARAARAQGRIARATVTLHGLDHDVCAVPQGRGDVLCTVRPARFASALAHDLNNAVTAVSWGAEMLLDDADLGPEGRAVARELLDTAHRIELMMEQLVTGSALTERGAHVDLGQELVALAPLLRRVMRGGATLAWDVARDAPCVRIDPVLLQRVLVNLVANAAQAGASTVTVRARSHASDGAGIDTAVLEVVDDGRGMSAERADRYGRARATDRCGGHGLGACATRDMVEQAHGTLTVESAEGAGTRVTVTLPAFLPRASGVFGWAPFVSANELG